MVSSDNEIKFAGGVSCGKGMDETFPENAILTPGILLDATTMLPAGGTGRCRPLHSLTTRVAP
jgi:hypothetical protein